MSNIVIQQSEAASTTTLLRLSLVTTRRFPCLTDAKYFPVGTQIGKSAQHEDKKVLPSPHDVVTSFALKYMPSCIPQELPERS